jgi:predicted SnoaL-like aldol condensation-catalyzing enzyme
MNNNTNKQIALRAFDTLFNKRDYATAEALWSPAYVQHSAYVPEGRDGLFNFIKSLPKSLRYEPGLAVSEGDHVILHGRFSGHGLRRNWIVADILRIKDGLLIEHWDVIQDEATQQESKGGKPMFGSTFASDGTT